MNLIPDRYVKNAYIIDYEKLYDNGFRGIIYDIDNTLTGHGKPAEQRTIAHFKKLKEMGFLVCFLSNNGRERVELFNEKIGAYYICNAKKPSLGGYEKAMKKMGTNKENTLFIGDQIFTDIWGAKKAGLFSILTKRLYFHEEIQIHLKRIIEKPVLLLFFLRGKKYEKD